MLPETPFEIRYIKLGLGGSYAADAIERGDIPLNFPEADHATCLRGDWTEVKQELEAKGRSKSAARQDIRELKAFYELPPGSLWISFAKGHLWWCLAGDTFKDMDRIEDNGPTRARATQGGWRNTSLGGAALTIDSLSSSLTKTGTYRRTICTVENADYLLRKIRDEEHPLILEMQTQTAALLETMQAMIQELHQDDFETLVDLIFARQGWQRTSRLGRDMPDIDLALEQPLTGAQAYVQVKASASLEIFKNYAARLSAFCDKADVYFVCADGIRGDQMVSEAHHGMTLWTGPEVARQALSAGLVDWVIQRVL